MDQAAADKVKKIREYLSKMTPGPYGMLVTEDIQLAALQLFTDAEWLLSQFSASEERVRDSFNEGILAAANRLGELMLHSPKYDRELLINAVLELRREQ